MWKSPRLKGLLVAVGWPDLPVQEAHAVADVGGAPHHGEVAVEGLQVHLQRPQRLCWVVVAIWCRAGRIPLSASCH